MKILGLDIGTSSIGSAWIDERSQSIHLGVSVFPAGVEQAGDRRGAPKNLARRESRSRRRMISRRAERIAALKDALLQWGWMPSGKAELKEWLIENPWHLRRAGLQRELDPKEFGRVLLHLAQRRGASWFDSEDDLLRDATKQTDTKRGPKAANEHLRSLMMNARKDDASPMTFGHFMANLFDQRKSNSKHANPIRNRNDAEGNPVYEFSPDRFMLRDEFERLWTKQTSFSGLLAEQLTSERKHDLSNPSGTHIWRHRGLLWGQRNTYWNIGTLGRCDLEPTDQVCPKADMYAQEFLVLQEANNIRVLFDGHLARPLNLEERDKVIEALKVQKTASAATVRKALGLNSKTIKNTVVLNLEEDTSRKLNTNWFIREIVSAIGVDVWRSLDRKAREAINRAVCKFDPREPKDVEKLAAGAIDGGLYGLAGGYLDHRCHGTAGRKAHQHRCQENAWVDA